MCAWLQLLIDLDDRILTTSLDSLRQSLLHSTGTFPRSCRDHRRLDRPSASCSPFSILRHRSLPIPRPLTSLALVREPIHVPYPHLRHVVCLRRCHGLEAVVIWIEAEGAVDGVAADDETECAEDDNEDDDEEGEGVAGVVAGDKGGHSGW